MTTTARRLAALLVAAAFLVPNASAAATAGRAATAAHASPAARVEVNAVSWKVDHPSRTITATVRIQLGSACTRAQYIRLSTHGGNWRRCLVTQQMVDEIRAQIDKVWNQGLTYHCYSLKVDVDIKLLADLDGAPAQTEKAPSDRIHIALDQTPATARSNVNTSPTVDKWNGRSTSDRLRPINDSSAPSTWRYPPRGSRGLYAHEVGHIMGLDDGYADDAMGNSVTRPDAPANDVMTDDDITAVDRSTIATLVERAGISAFDLKCDYTVDRDVPGGTIRGTKCGGLLGKWAIRTDITQGPARVKQKFNWTYEAGPADDPFQMLETAKTSGYGTVTTVKGDAAGRATVKVGDDGTVTWTLKEEIHTAVGTSKVAGRTFTVRTDEPLVTSTWTWEPTVCKTE